MSCCSPLVEARSSDSRRSRSDRMRCRSFRFADSFVVWCKADASPSSAVNVDAAAAAAAAAAVGDCVPPAASGDVDTATGDVERRDTFAAGTIPSLVSLAWPVADAPMLNARESFAAAFRSPPLEEKKARGGASVKSADPGTIGDEGTARLRDAASSLLLRFVLLGTAAAIQAVCDVTAVVLALLSAASSVVTCAPAKSLLTARAAHNVGVGARSLPLLTPLLTPLLLLLLLLPLLLLPLL